MANIKLKNANGQEVVYNGIEKIIVKDENDNDVVYGANYLQNPLIVTNVDTPPEITDVGKFVLNTTDNCMYRIEQAGSNEWVVEGEAGLDESEKFIGVAYGNGVWIASYSVSGTSSTRELHVYKSTDNGQTWSMVSQVFKTNLTKPIFYNGTFYIARLYYSSTSGARYGIDLCWSTDVSTWSSETAGFTQSSPSLTVKDVVVFDDKKVVLAGSVIRYKIGSGSWNEVSISDKVYGSSLVYGNGVVVIVGSLSSTGSIAYTETLSSVIRAYIGTIPYLNGVCYGGGKFVAVGQHGAVYYSTDGKNWSAGSGLPDKEFISVVYGNGIYVAVGANGSVYKSTDGITWTSMATLDTTRTYYGIATDGSNFVAVGSLGGVARTLPSSSYYYRKLRYDD